MHFIHVFGQNVFLHDSRQDAPKRTIFAVEILLARVRHVVALELRLVAEGLATVRAHVQLCLAVIARGYVKLVPGNDDRFISFASRLRQRGSYEERAGS